MQQGLITSTTPALAAEAGTERPVWREMLSDLRRDVPALIGAVLVLAIVLIAVLAPVIAPHDPNAIFPDAIDLNGQPVGPNSHFLFGADQTGHDLESRLIYGAQVSLTIGLLANTFAMIIGVSIGAVAAYFGRWVETVLMRLTDIVLAFPIFLFAIALINVTGQSVKNIVLVIALLYWTYTARVIHGMVLSIKEKEFVEAAHALGATHTRVLVRYILPHLVPIIIVYTTLGIATNVLLESSLSYVGIGVSFLTPSWGGIINDAQDYYRSAPWMTIFPGIAILATVLGFNLLGEWLRDELDPMQRNLG